MLRKSAFTEDLLRFPAMEATNDSCREQVRPKKAAFFLCWHGRWILEVLPFHIESCEERHSSGLNVLLGDLGISGGKGRMASVCK